MNNLSARVFTPARKERLAEVPRAKGAQPFWSKAPTAKAPLADEVGAPAMRGASAAWRRLKFQVTGHRPQAPPWRVILARVGEQHRRVREQEWKESEEGELLLDGRGCMHACMRSTRCCIGETQCRGCGLFAVGDAL